VGSYNLAKEAKMKVPLRIIVRPITLKLLLFLFLPVSLGAQASNAATYYVGKNGSSDYSCDQAQSPATPVRSVVVGIQCLSPGDTLIVGSGTYTEIVGPPMWFPSGTAKNPITIMANPGDVVTIAAPDWVNPYYTVLDLESVSNVIVKGFVVDAL